MKELIQIWEGLKDVKDIEAVGKIIEILKDHEDRINKIETSKKEIKSIDWIDEWLELFPKVLAGGGKPFRSNRIDCQLKLNNFVKKYKYNKDIILNATKAYIDSFNNDFTYARCAIYFIDKRGEGSDLATQCEEYLRNRNEPKKKEYLTSYNDFI